MARWWQRGSNADSAETRIGIDRQVREEQQGHFDALVQEGLERGLGSEQAQTEARRRFGDPQSYYRSGREVRLRRHRAMRRSESFSGLVHDARGGYRALRARPAFTAGAVLMLAIGIGVSTTLFSVVDAVLLRPLPLENPEQLYLIEDAPFSLRSGPARNADDVLDWHSHVAGTFEALAAYYPFAASVNVTGVGDAVRAGVTEVSPNFFTVLRPDMVLGRAFVAEETAANPHVAVLSERFWRREWHSDPEVLDREVSINGRPYQVVGIVPSRAQVPATPDIWVPMGYAIDDMLVRGARFFRVMGRLRPGVDAAAAASEVASFQSWLKSEFGDGTYGRSELGLLSLHDALVASVRAPIWLLFAATLLVLVVANANLANFMLARARWRQREYAVISAIGAGSRRLIQQAASESLLLALAGGAIGAALATWALSALRAAEHIALPRAETLGLDWRMLAFASLLAGISAVVTGMLPALAVIRPDLVSALRAGSTRELLGSDRSRPRDTLLVLQVGAALVLAAGAGLLVRSYSALQQVDAGYSRRTLTFAVTIDDHAYPNWVEVEQFVDRTVNELEALPGVSSAGAGNFLALADSITFGVGYSLEGAPESERFFATYLNVSPGYLSSMSLDLLQGRLLGTEDAAEAPLVGVVNEAFVAEHLAGRPAIGSRLISVGEDGPIEIIGVATNVLRHDLRDDPVPEMYRPMAQVNIRPKYFVMGVEGDPLALVPQVREAMRRVDPTMPVFDVRSMDQRVAGELAQPRLLAWLFSAFAFAGIGLAAFGLYATVTYWIAARTHEIGVRMAVGADAGRVLRLFLDRGVRRLVLGAAVGMAGYVVVARWVDETLLFGVAVDDAATLLSSAALMMAVALLAILAAAWRAARLDPVTALRAD